MFDHNYRTELQFMLLNKAGKWQGKLTRLSNLPNEDVKITDNMPIKFARFAINLARGYHTEVEWPWNSLALLLSTRTQLQES